MKHLKIIQLRVYGTIFFFCKIRLKVQKQVIQDGNNAMCLWQSELIIRNNSYLLSIQNEQ